jgi:hypothetical protein
MHMKTATLLWFPATVGTIWLGTSQAATAPDSDRKSDGELACKVDLLAPPAEATVDAPVRIKVNGHELSLGRTPMNAESLRVYPADAASVLVAIVYVGSSEGDPNGGNSLWRVPCAAGGQPSKVAQSEGADFGHSALAADGRQLFYTGADGIFALNLRTWKSRRLTTAAFAYCKENEMTARDVVGELTPGGDLLFDRGCHYAWQWHGKGMRLRRPDSRKPVAQAAPRPPLPAVAVDAAGGIWLSDGWCEDRSTWQRLLHSSNRGQHWSVVGVKPDPKLPVGQGIIRQIIADTKNPKALLVFVQSCESSDQHTAADWIYVTEDGGAAFRAVAIPPGLADVQGQGPLYEANPLFAVSAEEGSLSTLTLYGDSADRLAGAIGRWSSRDLGRTWKPSRPIKMRIESLPTSPARASFHDWQVTIEPDGLRLSQPGKAASLIYRRR